MLHRFTSTFSHLSFIALITALGTLLAKASEPVVIGSPVVIQGEKTNALPVASTEIEFAEGGTDAGIVGLSERAPNFFVASSGAHSFNDTFALRGLTNTPIFGDAAVTFYLDDIPLGGGFTTPDIFPGVSSALLGRGPGQNTLFGRAGSAGVVRLATPELGKNATGQIDLSAGNFSARKVAVTAASAGSGKAEALVCAQFETRDGYIFNEFLGHDVDHRQATNGLARLGFRLTDTIGLKLVAQAARVRDGEQPLVPLNGPLFTINRKTQGETNLDTFNTGLSADTLMPWGHLSFTSSLNDWRLGPYRSVLAFGPVELLNDVRQSQRNYNQELRLASDDKGDFRWHSGLFFSDGSTKGTFTRAFGSYVSEDSTYTIDAKRLAAYDEVSVDFQPALTLTAGLRIESAKKSFERSERAPSTQLFALNHESATVLPKLELNYTPAENLRVFGSVGTGFKPGGFSAFTGNRALAAFGSERTLALEAGATRTALNNTLSVTGRAFLYEIRGYQIERSFATGSMTDDYLVVNAPKARSTGAELELAWRPVTGLSIASSFGLTQVTLRQFKDPFTGQSFDGKSAPYVPRYDFTLRCEYKHSSGWFGSLNWTENGQTYYTESEDKAFAQGAYGLLGGRLGIEIGRWRLAVYAENITNRHYYSSISAGTMHGTPGAPRIQGLEARFSF